NLKNVVLPAPAYREDFDSYAEFTFPPGWNAVNFTSTDTPGEDPSDLSSDTYKGWVIVSQSRLSDLKSKIFDGPAAGQSSNGVPVTADNFSGGNLLYAESDTRGGSQVQFIYTKA